jgi:hypothetical protein
MSLSVLFLLVAVILFVVSSFGVNVPKVNLGWAGMAFFACSFLIAGVDFVT